MSFSRLTLTVFPLALGLLLVGLQPIANAQQAAPAKPKTDVPMLDASPTLTLPLPNKGAVQTPPANKGAVIESVPLPSLRPVAPTSDPLQKVSSTRSEIGQFVIQGADLETRNFIAKICEDTAAEVSELLRDPEHFEIPIVVYVKTAPNISASGPAVSTDVAELAFGGFRLQITAQMRPDFNLPDFREELVHMLIAERILRNHKRVETTRTSILPNWLLVGVKEALQFRSRARPSAVFASVFRSGKVYSIEEILEATPTSLDSLSRAIYETSCCALVLTLLDQPDGNMRMGKFINSLATDSKSDREMLNRWFPGLNATKSSLNKWWALQMATLATPTVFETLGPSETAKELEQALYLHYETAASDAPAAHVASTEEKALDADADKENKKRGFFGRLFAGSESDEEKPLKAASKPRPEAKPKPVAKAEPKKEQPSKADTKKEVAADDAPEKSASPLRRLFGFGSKATVVSSSPSEPKKEDKPKAEPKKEDKPKAEPKKEDKPKAEPKKEDKPKAEPKKEDKPKAEPKKEDKPKAEPKKEDKPKAEPKKEDKPKAEPKKEDKPKAEPKKEDKPKPDTTKEESKKDDKEKRPGFFGRMFSGSSKEDEKPADKAKDSDKKKELKAKPETKSESKKEDKKSKDEGKPSAAVLDASTLVRLLADTALPSFGVIADASGWAERSQPHYVSFLGFGKKKEADEGDDASSKKKEDKKSDSKKKEDKPKAEPKKEDKKPEPKPEPAKAEPKKESTTKAAAPKPKKERMVAASIPLSDYSRIAKRSDAKQIFNTTLSNLNALAARAHPLFRPLIREYSALVLEMADQKAKNVDERLKELRVKRDQALAQAKAVREQLDVFEANESTEYSGLFDDFLRLPKIIEQEIPRRTDVLSKTLDELEKLPNK